MILIDTSIWIDFLAKDNPDVSRILVADLALTHDMVIGELAMGSLRDRDRTLSLIGNLPRATRVHDWEVIQAINAHRLHGMGLSFVDAHLLTSVWLTPGSRLWTLDRRLRSASVAFGVAFDTDEG